MFSKCLAKRLSTDSIASIWLIRVSLTQRYPANRKLKNKMLDIATYTDRDIVNAILNRDTLITKEFLYKKCYPLFKAVFDKYYTDCNNCFEFINEISVYIMYPHKETHVSKLSGFGFRCTLTMWLKIVSENYCHQLYTRKIETVDTTEVVGDRKLPDDDSLVSETRNLDMHDLSKILTSMPNERYRRLIECRYVDDKTNEETAVLLGLTMANYYNTHKRAKEQFCAILRKEGLI